MSAGQKFGHLTVVAESGTSKGGRLWRFRCDCGTEEVRPIRDVRVSARRGFAPCCQKCKSAISAETGRANRTHGLTMTHPNLYGVHRQMMRRCYDPGCPDFPAYGQRGIAVCGAWHDPVAFVQWADATGYRRGLTIERQDVNGHYAPANCTWIVNERQARNTRKVIRLTLNGDTRPLTEWAERFGISPRTIKQRIGLGWDHDSAVKVPPVRGRNQFGGAA